MGVTVLGIQHHFYPRSPCGERPHAWLKGESQSVISIHALLAESDNLLCLLIFAWLIFLSTLSLRRATLFFGRYAAESWYFYPRSPCGERPIQTLIQAMERLFLSTLSLRRATGSYPSGCQRLCISIHALLAESDSIMFVNLRVVDISIHALLAESDTIFRPLCGRILVFLSTLSLRRATYTDLNSSYGALISIHALLAESDLMMV